MHCTHTHRTGAGSDGGGSGCWTEGKKVTGTVTVGLNPQPFPAVSVRWYETRRI